MVKSLSLLPLLSMFSMLALSPLKAQDFRPYLHTEGNTLVSIDQSFHDDELRIYHYEDLPIDTISDSAFSGTTFSSLMMTRSIAHVNSAAFDNAQNIENMYYTGSEAQYQALGLTHVFTTVRYYAYDEGFINYWDDNIRPTAETNICDMDASTFQEMYRYYRELSDEDLESVNNHTDIAGAKIKDSIKELSNQFVGSNQSQKTEEWNQTGAITLIIFIAVIGMTSITIFFLLKTRNIIQ